MTQEEQAHAQNLQTELRAVLSRFKKCFGPRSPVQLPTQADLKRFRLLVEGLYLAAGNKKVNRLKFWNMVKAVDTRWCGLHVRTTITKLVDRFSKHVPAGPRTKLHKRWMEINKSASLTTSQQELLELLGMTEVTKSAANWIKFSDDLDSVITSDTAKSLLKASAADATSCSWLKFLDAHQQVLAWHLEFGALFDSFTLWVHTLQNDTLSERLESISWNSTLMPTAAEMIKVKKKRTVRLRQMRHRRKSKESDANRGQ